MKQRYDFSKGIRGKFFKPNAAFKLPVYLDVEVEGYLTKRAQAKGVELDELVNQLLRREIEIIEGGVSLLHTRNYRPDPLARS